MGTVSFCSPSECNRLHLNLRWALPHNSSTLAQVSICFEHWWFWPSPNSTSLLSPCLPSHEVSPLSAGRPVSPDFENFTMMQVSFCLRIFEQEMWLLIMCWRVFMLETLKIHVTRRGIKLYYESSERLYYNKNSTFKRNTKLTLKDFSLQ